MTRRTVAISAAASALLAVSACSTTVTGTPSPKPRATSSSPSAREALNALDACTMLDQLLAGQGFEPGDRISRRNECDAVKPGYGTAGIALDPARGLAESQAEEPHSAPTEINGRRALVGTFTGAGTCDVVLEVGEHARASAAVVLVDPAAYAQACPAARELATALEPLLPR